MKRSRGTNILVRAHLVLGQLGGSSCGLRCSTRCAGSHVQHNMGVVHGHRGVDREAGGTALALVLRLSWLHLKSRKGLAAVAGNEGAISGRTRLLLHKLASTHPWTLWIFDHSPGPRDRRLIVLVVVAIVGYRGLADVSVEVLIDRDSILSPSSARASSLRSGGAFMCTTECSPILCAAWARMKLLLEGKHLLNVHVRAGCCALIEVNRCRILES